MKPVDRAASGECIASDAEPANSSCSQGVQYRSQIHTHETTMQPQCLLFCQAANQISNDAGMLLVVIFGVTEVILVQRRKQNLLTA